MDSRIRISIHDQGPGIALEARKRIFDRFVQEDSSDTRTIDGTGLGLSISRAIVREHGGEIGVESDIARGSTFYFDIPLAMDDRDIADPSPHKQGAV